MWTQCPACKLVQQPAATCGNCGQALPTSPAPPPPPPTEPPWYYARDGQTIGPVPFDDLREFARRGTLKPTDHVLQHGTSNWVAAGTVAGLFPQQLPPPPPSQSAGEAVAYAEIVPEEELQPYLPLGARARSQLVARPKLTWGCLGACALFFLASAVVLVIARLMQGPGDVVGCSATVFVLSFLAMLAFGSAALKEQKKARQVGIDREEELNYGLAWARFQQESARAAKAWAEVKKLEGPDQISRLLAMIPTEPLAVYWGFADSRGKTYTFEALDDDTLALLADGLRYLICRNLFRLRLPASSLGRARIEARQAFVFRVEMNENIHLEVCIAVDVVGCTLTLTWSPNVLSLYPNEINAFFGPRYDPINIDDLNDVGAAFTHPPQEAEQYRDVRYGHTAVWARINSYRRVRPNEIVSTTECPFTFTTPDTNALARAEALVKQIEAAIGRAEVEWRPPADLPPVHRSPGPPGEQAPRW